MISNHIDKAVEILNRNDIISIPTETVYGLAGNAYSEEAVKKIFKLKQRPYFNPLIVHIESIKYLNKIAMDIPRLAYKIADTYWPGPLTMILKKQPHISNIITANKNTVAVRIPNHSLTLSLLNKLEYPLVAPSANPFGSISPTSAQHVFNYFKNDLELVLDGGECQTGIESTIIGFDNNNKPILYRLGSIPLEDLEKTVGKLSFSNNNNHQPEAPGMLSRHYAPKTQTFVTKDPESLLNNFRDKKIGVLLFNRNITHSQIKYQEVLSLSGNFKEAARNLYAAMHRLDNFNLDVIIAELLPEIDLGLSINDKLKRASKS